MEREKIERVARKIARVHAGEPDGTVRAVVDGIEWALSHQWTRVADRKPEPYEWCLLKIEGSGVLLGLGKNIDDGGLPVTHWMLVPEIREEQ